MILDDKYSFLCGTMDLCQFNFYFFQRRILLEFVHYTGFLIYQPMMKGFSIDSWLTIKGFSFDSLLTIKGFSFDSPSYKGL